MKFLLAFIVAASVCDQGAPGRQGPWAVTVLTDATTLMSKANVPATLGSVSVAGSSCDSSQTTAVSGLTTGSPCAVSGPANPNMTFQCITGSGVVTWKFCNAAVFPVSTVAGSYTAVVF